VLESLRCWVDSVVSADRSIEAVGYFGSYARGEEGVGSDLDIVMIVACSELPFERRAVRYDTSPLPVPVELIVYTAEEWARMLAEGNHFVRRVEAETVWLYRRGAARGTGSS